MRLAAGSPRSPQAVQSAPTDTDRHSLYPDCIPNASVRRKITARLNYPVMPIDNGSIADAFDEMAELLELRGENQFRVRAYRNVPKRFAN